LIPDLKQAIVLVTPEGREEEVVTRLARVGYDNTLGYLKGGIEAWKAAGKELDAIESIDATELAKRMEADQVEHLLDVRKPTEFISQHALVAENIPLDYINNNMHRLNPQDTYYLHCGGGYRSMVFASILRARGFEHLVDIKGGWKAIEAEANIAKTDFACPTSIPQDVIDEAIANAI
jgi:rhodanese-related sulfurtransferase